MDKKILTILVLVVIAAGLVIPLAIAGKPSIGILRGQPQCKDGIDNDGDGYTDWPSDPGCSSKTDKSELNPNVECDDGTDNDGDGATDYNDGGCSGPTDNDETNCGDGVCEGGETQGNCPEDCGYSDSCNDTDGGNVITVFGTTLGYYNNEWYSNDDYCTDLGNIMEYYCSGNYEQNQQQSCGTDEYGSPYCSAGDTIYKDYTDYYCSGGECDYNTTPVFQEDCDDSDGYVGNNYCLNESVYRDWRNYYCNNGACDYAEWPVLQEECNYGCTNGTCNSPPDSCTDTDGGYDILEQGVVYGYSNGESYNYTDFCNTTLLIEYYCVGSSYTADSFDCSMNFTSCTNGACTL